MRSLRACLALVLAAPALATAQAAGLPIVNNGIPSGVTVAADVGFPGDELGGGTAVGAGLTAGFGVIGVGAQVARHAWEGQGVDGTTSLGGTATLRLFGGPLVPFRVLLQGGYAYSEFRIDDVPEVSFHRGTASLGFAATIPVPAFALKPWIAPRLQRVSFEGNGFTEFGLSGGIELGFLNGMTIRTAYDRTWLDRTGIEGQAGVWSVGLGWGL